MNRGRVLSLIATLTALLFAVGCGSSGSEEVTVQTGSLSKAEFIKKADAICEAARSEFLAKLSRFFKVHEKTLVNDPAESKEVLLPEVLESLLQPNIEGQVEQISTLGAPKDYAPEVADFLNALQDRMDKALENPPGFTTTPTPFVVAENIARRVALKGCSESFS
jgi:hypothetical protein